MNFSNNPSNQTKKSLMYGWMMVLLILGSSGESVGSGTGGSMNFGEESSETTKSQKIANGNEEEKKDKEEWIKKMKAPPQEYAFRFRRVKQGQKLPAGAYPMEVLEQELKRRIDDLNKKLHDKKDSGDLKREIEKLLWKIEDKSLSEMERVVLEKELEENKKELWAIDELKKKLKIKQCELSSAMRGTYVNFVKKRGVDLKHSSEEIIKTNKQ